MELKDEVIMDITESFRTEDIKTDFFDFVVTPDASDVHSIQQFAKQMRSVNAFLETTGPDEKSDNNGNNAASTPTPNAATANMLATELVSVPTTSTSADGNAAFDSTFWSDKETVRIETAILEDLNKYWAAEESSQGTSKATADGQIYTLTVLNGLDQNATWYRQPLSSIVKDEDVSMSSPGSMEHLQANLDIDSILSIIPNQINGFNSNYNEPTMSPNTDGLIKSETYTYEDSGYADNKEELANQLIIDTPLLEAHDNFNNNNNDWKMSNNNTSTNDSTGNSSTSTPDSLLRSALQGKAFVRYNGMKTTQVKQENNAELRRVLSTPPSKSDHVFIKEEPDHIPTIVAGIDANGKVVFGEQINPLRGLEPNNPTSTHSVDDLLLSQLDQTFPEDFEKIKRIANEVAESVNQYCHIETAGDGAVYSISTDQIGLLNNLSSPIQISAPVVTSTKPATKKYKRQNSGAKTQTTVQSATSTSNGVRKERSLHYCSICSKGFKDKYSVNVHIRTHTGEKPFSCTLCGKSFRQKAHLAKHYQTHVAQKNAAAAGAAPAPKAKSRICGSLLVLIGLVLLRHSTKRYW